ncbi:amylo-alpha-1,6-glucosidase [Nocardioides sp. URHA0020]|uniref:amylo-alpha-1,6-glucosidase n=1 Tax=Nocardioides sp. URHA0020 TaxID=1380392 RepID=UPI000490FDAB|nr:glycogen debranching protein [Nocardioides sp. URHA0020]
MTSSGPWGSGAPSFDLREIPFSYRGSWLDLSPVVGLDACSDTVHLVSHRNGFHAVLGLRPERSGSAVEPEWHAGATSLTWRHGDAATGATAATVEAAFDGPDAIRLRGDGLALRLVDAAGALTPFTGSYLFDDPVDGAAVLTSYETGRRYRVTSLAGRIEVIGAGALGVAERAVLLGGDGAAWEAVVQEIETAADPYASGRSFDEVVAGVAADFDDYLGAVAPWRDDTTPAAALACYVLWSATVAPDGFMTRESVLMSKHWMDKVWSWDHCFNALALASGLPEVALDQWLAPFDHQDGSGALPDSITHSEVLRNFVKPPVHGWALRRLRAGAGRLLTEAELVEVHDRLAAWSRFWLDHRRRPGHPLPYYQHGNDSGWDNATTFDRERVVEAPDLAALLAVQLDVLGDLAAEIGRPAEHWHRSRDELGEALLARLWTGAEFVAVGALDGRASGASSLLSLLPLVLGERLPAAVRTTLADRVARHLTPWGLATEPVDSPLYEADGYWRGPIWAPSTALVEDGLRSSGFVELADTVSERFRRLCEQSGFAENFDAGTGAGLRDRAYTWTASVYLTLAAAHVERDARSTDSGRTD